MRVLATVFLLSFAALAQQPAQPQSGTYHVGVGVSAPRCDYMPDPQYSEELRKTDIKGTVVLSATVGIDGCLRDIKAVRKLGYGLDEAAEEAVRLWHCRPVFKNGKPTPSKITVELNFDPTVVPVKSSLDVKPCTERVD